MNVKVGPALALVLGLITSSIGHSQSARKHSGSAAQASLTVSARVESSVWLMDPDGKREIVVANAPDPKASFSHSRPHSQKSVAKAESPAAKQTAKTQAPAPHEEAAVEFSFPADTQQFDVTRETVGNVVVTTVVPQ